MSRKPEPISLTELIVCIALGCFLIGAVFGTILSSITVKEPSAANYTAEAKLAAHKGTNDEGRHPDYQRDP